MPAPVSETIPSSLPRTRVGPSQLFKTVSIAEAITWTLLLVGMFLKYVTRTTDVGVRIFGTLHGAVFIAYGVTTVLVWIDQRWSWRRGLTALACAIPPFATLVFDRWVERHDILGDSWRLRSAAPRGLFERLAAWAVHHPVAGGCSPWPSWWHCSASPLSSARRSAADCPAPMRRPAQEISDCGRSRRRGWR